jgi:ubiquinone/menaquinone biosynthesis C-methylase UbiE
MTGELAGYYAARAAEYDRVYEKPERQADLAELRRIVPDYFQGRRVLEVACGTGYWTALLARGAASVVATDIGTEVMEIARSRKMPANAVVDFHLADAFDLSGVPGDFDAAFAGFWWSHVRREDLSTFLRGLHGRLQPEARVMILDNRYVEGSSTPIDRVDSAGNSFQRRKLDSGAEHEVLKNFPSGAEVSEHIRASGAGSVVVSELTYYWYATYVIHSA